MYIVLVRVTRERISDSIDPLIRARSVREACAGDGCFFCAYTVRRTVYNVLFVRTTMTATGSLLSARRALRNEDDDNNYAEEERRAEADAAQRRRRRRPGGGNSCARLFEPDAHGTRGASLVVCGRYTEVMFNESCDESSKGRGEAESRHLRLYVCVCEYVFHCFGGESIKRASRVRE